MSEKGRILYFVPERKALEDGILYSQVLAQAQSLQNVGYKCLFVGTEDSGSSSFQATKKIEKEYSIASNIHACYNARFGLPSLMYTAWRTMNLASTSIQQFKPTHVYTRSLGSSVFGRKIARQNKIVSVYDVRGASIEEVAMRRGGKKRMAYKIIRWFLRREINKSDCLSCVTHNLKSWIEQLTGRKDVTVIPCCVNGNEMFFDGNSRKQIRKKYGFGRDNKVVCYAGGLSVWQRVSDIVKLFVSIAKINSSYRFLFITKEADHLNNIILQHNLPLERFVVVSCEYKDMHKYLSIADAGIIMRDDNIVNNVACPVKIGEYLSCGLPILLTRGIGDYSRMIAESGVGIVIEENDNIAQQIIEFLERPDFSMQRDRAISLSKEHFSFNGYLDEFEKLFSKQNDLPM
ncbi:glycosyltransferase [Planctomycetota bacterium]